MTTNESPKHGNSVHDGSSSIARRAAAGLAALATLAAGATAQVQVDWVVGTRGVMVAVDGADNVFTADFEQALGSEITVTKRDVDGHLLWVSEIDQTDNTKWERAQWVAVDSQGAVLVCGTLMSGFSNPVEAASLLLKFRPDGTPVYRIVYESGFDGSSTRKLLLDEADNAYVLGRSPAVTQIKKFTSDGAPVWTWLDPYGIGLPVNFKFAPGGDMVLAGRSLFGSINGYARVDRKGNSVWGLPGVPSLTVGDVAGDGLGNSYLVHGEFVTNGGTMIKKLDPQGVLLWEATYPSSGFRIEVGSDQAAVVSGFPNSGAPGAAFFKVDPGGSLLWSNLDADGPLGLLLHAHMLLDASDNAFLAASTLFQMAVCKVRADGTSAWTATTTGSNSSGIALGNQVGTVFVTGGNTARLVEDVLEIGTPYCLGDGTGTACPCANNGSAGRGCANSVNASGARLAGSGTASIGSDTLVLTGSGMPNSSALYLQGVAQAGGGMGTVFGDGLLCVTTSVIRLGAMTNTAGASEYPGVGGPAVSVRGLVTSPGTRMYQVWYRNADVFCTPSTFNLSNGLSISWTP